MSRPHNLKFTAVQPGELREIDFPLHPQTVSQEAVGAMLEGLLGNLSEFIESRGRLSDGDVLQAVCMLLAIRMNMVDAPHGAVQELVAQVLEQAD